MNKLDDDDVELFRSAVGDVKPVNNDRIEVSKPAPVAIPLQLRRDEQQVLDDLLSGDGDPEDSSFGDDIQFYRPGVRLNTLRKLRRGQFSVGGELDLHGLTASEAKIRLSEFIKDVLSRGTRCVRIIHGKGRRSSNKGPVLKPLTAKWLSRHDDVLAFCNARPVDGGAGAVYVLLRK